ncbi:MAG: hypothetical protein MRZ79_17900 [Bacteroidia bacterium]|nr:hypothetical protein [Bacteroidia bacterium]
MLSINKIINHILRNKQDIILWVSVLLLTFGVMAGLSYLALERTENSFVFPLDDTYIHLAIADQILESGNWGPSPFQFQYSSSSPGYSLLLSFVSSIFPSSPLLPLLINAIFLILFSWVVVKISATPKVGPFTRFLLVMAVMILIPIHLLGLLGMEHLGHLFFSTLFLREASRKMAQPKTHPNGLLILAGIFMCFFRYEGLFMIAGYGLVGFSEKKFKMVIFSSLFCILPLAVLGIYMLSQGGSFLPISILGKSQGSELFAGKLVSWLAKGANNFYENPFIISLILAQLSLLLFKLKREVRIWILIWLIAMLQHLLFSEIGGYRYEAYLIATGLLSFLQLNISKLDIPLLSVFQKQVLVLIASILLFPLLLRSVYFTANYPLFCQNIYQQPIQVAKFLDRYYKGESVGMNDIGASSYFAKVQLTDLVGIGDNAVFKFRKSGNYNAVVIESLARKRKMRIAVIHEIWLEDWIPESWTKVGTWTLSDNLICADKSLSFFACEEKEIEALRENLVQFAQSTLPNDVKTELFVE